MSMKNNKVGIAPRTPRYRGCSMNDAQRNVIQRHIRQLANDLIMTDNFYAALYQNKIFERNMIDIIKAEKTEGEQVYKMLELLPKRGPDAFDIFVQIIEHDYPWLASMLVSSLKQETARVPTRGDPFKVDNDLRGSIDLSVIDMDLDIKSKTSTFIHRQFGQSKRISENDKKTMIRWLSQQLQSERKRLASASSESSDSTVIIHMKDKCVGTETNNTDIQNLDISRRVQHLWDRLQEYKRTSNNNSVNSSYSVSTTSDTTSSTLGIKSPLMTRENTVVNDRKRHQITPATFDMLLSEVEVLLEKVEIMENEFAKCLSIMGNKDRSMSLSLLIYDVMIKAKNTDKEIKAEKQKSDKMLTELYEYSSKVTRLEQTKIQQKSLLDNKTNEVDRLNRDIQHLKDKITQYEQMSKLHTEKQNTLENLKMMVRDIQQNKVKDGGGTKSVSSRASTETFSRSVGGRPINRYSPSKSRTGTRSVTSNNSSNSPQQQNVRKYGQYNRMPPKKM